VLECPYGCMLLCYLVLVYRMSPITCRHGDPSTTGQECSSTTIGMETGHYWPGVLQHNYMYLHIAPSGNTSTFSQHGLWHIMKCTKAILPPIKNYCFHISANKIASHCLFLLSKTPLPLAR